MYNNLYDKYNKPITTNDILVEKQKEEIKVKDMLIEKLKDEIKIKDVLIEKLQDEIKIKDVLLDSPEDEIKSKTRNILMGKPIDDGKPKRSLTSYNQFLKFELLKIKAEQPNITHKAAFTEAAQRWKVSPDNPKNKVNGRKRHMKGNANGIGINGIEDQKPKRALTSYNQFLKQELLKIKAEQPNITHKAAFTEAAQRWSVSPYNPKNKY